MAASTLRTEALGGPSLRPPALNDALLVVDVATRVATRGARAVVGRVTHGRTGL